MSNAEQMRKNLLDKIKELFQLNQPDLDFGFYRIMHSRAKEITEFIEKDLLATIEAAFASAKVESFQSEFDAAKKKILDAIGEDAFDENGTLKPAYANSKAGREFLEVQRKLASSEAIASGEESVYYHLYKFFSRYYDNGDFISTRYHTRETDSMAKPYAIPYGGEEVMLYWANADQYYIKTSENFNNFSFDLTKAKIFDNMTPEERILAGVPEHTLPVHFKVVEAEEGEHGNIKADSGKRREFFLAGQEPVALNATGELEVRFEYRLRGENDTVSAEKEKQVKDQFEAENKGDISLLVMTDELLSACDNLRQRMEADGKDVTLIGEFITAMKHLSPTDKVKKRVLITRYLYQYTARNTADYFIHKNLRGFLRREMDFYIKNEIMNLDDVENSDVATVENYLILLKVFRRIAGKLIDFLGQLEDFQKKLWLKKKFVVQCDYCITIDRIPEKFYPAIFSNQKQLNEWQSLGLLSGVDLKPEEWKARANNELSYLMVDTKFFESDFKNSLIASIPDFDEQCDGVLIHSENFQALNLLQERYREQVKCIYIDPPYNTGNDGFIYKDNYQHSAWLSMIKNRLELAKLSMREDGAIFISIDDVEQEKCKLLCNQIFDADNFIAQLIWERAYAPKNDAKFISNSHDYILMYALNKEIYQIGRLARTENANARYKNIDNDPRGPWKPSDMSVKTYSASNDYPITLPSGKIVKPPAGRCWSLSKNAFLERLRDNRIWFGPDGNSVPCIKRFLTELKFEGMAPTSILFYKEVGHSQEGAKEVKNDIGLPAFDGPKPTRLLNRILVLSRFFQESISLDFFAGSGTTGHAVINLNREDGGKRKYILVEMGDHFDTVLKPRLEKVVFSEKWQDGKPVMTSPVKLKQRIHQNKIIERDNNNKELTLALDFGLDSQALERNEDFKERNPFNGVSHCFKYMRLESYEDTLNNLTLKENRIVQNMPPSLKDDYMLHYMLDTEAHDSLLNIRNFANPFGGYQLNIKQPATEATMATTVDMLETFNYLIGLRVQQYYRLQAYTASFQRPTDPELPEDSKNPNTRLELAGRPELDAGGKWRFQKIEGWLPANPLTPNDGQRKNVLIIWRTLTGNLEQDNLMLDWYLGDTVNLNERRSEYDIIYVNGSNNLGADRKETDTFQVRLIEEEFLKKMWSGEEF